MISDPPPGFPGRFEILPDGGWRVVVPVRAEHVVFDKRTVVYEEVDIQREFVEAEPPA